jgi:hypothetical protein
MNRSGLRTRLSVLRVRVFHIGHLWTAVDAPIERFFAPIEGPVYGPVPAETSTT